MSFIGYYAFHSFINQVRKMLKTWVLIFILACGLIGGLIGYGAARLSDISDERSGQSDVQEWYDGEYGNELPDGLPSELPDGTAIPGFEDGEVIETDVIAGSGMQAFELIYGGLILAAILFSIFMAGRGKGSRFLPADVSLLFASPLRPQTVLFFRLLMQVGVMIYMTVYMLINFGNIARNMGIGLFPRVAVMLGWFLAMFFGKLLETYLYLASAENEKVRKYADALLYALILIPAASWFAYWKLHGGVPFEAAMGFFNAPLSRAVPIWGWIKGMGMYAAEGNVPMFALCFAVTVFAAGLFIRHIWHMKADFYEDAMAKSEELALAMREIEERKSSFGTIGKKKRKEGLERDGMTRGTGADVFFWKSVLNRRRFSKLMLITKTSVFYLAVASAAAFFTKNVIGSDSAVPAMFAIGVMVFFRALGNPLEEDTKVSYTAFIPEYAWKKLTFSALGGTLNCLLDLIPGIAAAAIMMRTDFRTMLLCVPLILTIDLYAGSCGSFIALSTPANAGVTIKQLIQILFIYFGLLPDVGIIAVAAVFEKLGLGIAATSLFNVLLSMVFISASGCMLDPKTGRRVYNADNAPGDPAEAKFVFDRIGRALFAMMAISTFLQLLAARQLPQGFALDHPWLVWVVQMAPLYLVAVPIGVLIMKKLPVTKAAEPLRMSLLGWLSLIPIGFFLMYGGNIIGTVIGAVIMQLLGGGAATTTDLNPLMDLFSNTQFLPRTIVVVIMAPVIEELLFRKMLIDRTRVYGEKTAVVFSALCFGLFHGNFSQFCYASLLGLLLGAVYLKTGRIIHTIGLHMCVNFMGGVIAPKIMTLMLDDSAEGAYPVPVLAFFSLIVLLFFLGAAVFIQYKGRLFYETAPRQLRPADARRCAWLNAGTIMFVVFALCCIGYAMLF